MRSEKNYPRLENKYNWPEIRREKSGVIFALYVK